MVKYTREQRLRAVRWHEQYDRSAASVINKLGYPSRGMHACWHRVWGRGGTRRRRITWRQAWGTLHAGAQADGRRPLFHPRPVCTAHDPRVGMSQSRGVGALDRRAGAGTRRLRRAPVDEATRHKVVARYASGEATSRRIGEELGVSADVVRNWKHTMLAGDDKEGTVGYDRHRSQTRHGVSLSVC